MTRTNRLNDDERGDWIMNDEGLYLWFMGERYNRKTLSLSTFIKENRADLDRFILGVLNQEPGR